MWSNSPFFWPIAEKPTQTCIDRIVEKSSKNKSWFLWCDKQIGENSPSYLKRVHLGGSRGSKRIASKGGPLSIELIIGLMNSIDNKGRMRTFFVNTLKKDTLFHNDKLKQRVMLPWPSKPTTSTKWRFKENQSPHFVLTTTFQINHFFFASTLYS